MFFYKSTYNISTKIIGKHIFIGAERYETPCTTFYKNVTFSQNRLLLSSILLYYTCSFGTFIRFQYHMNHLHYIVIRIVCTHTFTGVSLENRILPKEVCSRDHLFYILDLGSERYGHIYTAQLGLHHLLGPANGVHPGRKDAPSGI